MSAVFIRQVITFLLLKVDILLYPGHSSKPDDDKMKNIHIQKMIKNVFHYNQRILFTSHLDVL